MRAAVLRAKQELVCSEVAIPVPRSYEVLIRVSYCGVCGSDVPRYVNGAVHSFPLVLGHEFSGVVDQVGEGVEDSLIGKRVVGIPLVPCMKCNDCSSGNYSLCKHYSFIGSRQPGAYAEYVRTPVTNIIPIPDSVSLRDAAFFEPASVAQHAVDLIGVERGKSAVIVGCGTIGILLAQILQAHGVSVVGLARREERLVAAYAAGVESLCNTSLTDWRDSLMANRSEGGFDYVFDTSGNSQMMVESYGFATNKGIVCMVGTPKQPMTFSVREWEHLNRKELTVMGSWMSYSKPWPGREWFEISELFSSGAIRIVDEMIGNIYTLEEIPEGMKEFCKPNAITGKILIDCR